MKLIIIKFLSIERCSIIKTTRTESVTISPFKIGILRYIISPMPIVTTFNASNRLI